MTNPRGTAQVGMEFISNMFVGADKRLDQSKKSLEKLKKEAGSNTAANIYATFIADFKIDLEEDNVKGEVAQKPYLDLIKPVWDAEQMDTKMRIIDSSSELKDVEAFITKLENLPLLADLIKNAEPQAKWESMLKGFASKIPGLSEFIDKGGFDTVLTSLGLGFLVKPKKARGGQAGSQLTTSGDKKGNPEKTESADDKEKKEVQRKTPGSTLFMGDSITVGVPGHGKDIFKINGTIDCIAKGGMSSGWGRGEAARWASEKREKAPENAVILFGTNDLLGSPDSIINNLQDIYRTLYKAKPAIKRIYAVTIPPHEGYAPYDKSPKANETRHIVNAWIRGEDPNRPKPQYVHHVMDTCKEEKDGGLATNGNPERLNKNVTGDNLHIDKKELATFYQRELEIGSAEPDKTYD